jgi:microcystin-dependent protein
MYFATLDVGTGWLLADGSEVDRVTYANLFAKIGTLYGSGDGTTTFNLPDGRNRSLISVGSSYAFTTKYVGEATHTMTESELVPHTHTWDGPESRTEEKGDGANNVWKNLDPNAITGSTGSGTPFNVVHPCVIGYLHIKT